MGSLSYTAADIKPLPGAIVRRFEAGATLTPGDAVYMASDGAVELADADAEASARVIGIVLADSEGRTSFSAGDKIDVAVYGPVAGFSSLTPGALGYASTTAGDIGDTRPAGSSGDYVWIIGWAEQTTVFFVAPFTDDFAAQ